MHRLALLLLIPLFFSCATAPRPSPEWRFAADAPQAVSSGGMVVSDSPLATRAGVEILRQGGNAIDAAVATAFVLAVVYPEAGNLGGGGFLVAHLNDGRSVALDFRERAPFAATPTMYLDSIGNPTERSLVGHLAAGVPGSVAGLWEAHRRYGSSPWKSLLAPALRFARTGFTVDGRFSRTLHADSATLMLFEGSRRLFLPDGRPLAAGTHWSNPDLAGTLERIAEQGKDGFYSGATANLIVDEMKRGGGLITLRDLQEYTAVWRTPLVFPYRGYTAISIPPPSSGGVTLALLCNILSDENLSEFGWHSPEAMHLTAEAMRRAFAVRNAYLGDPDVVRVPLDSLLSPDFARAQHASIDPQHATPSSLIAPGPQARPRDGMHTTHVSVVDQQGNAVALTTTINSLYGNCVTVTGAGFLLNNEMDDFAAKPGSPNMFGLVQGEANAIAPGKRVLSSMTPLILLDPARSPLLVTGARGGPHIITAVFHLLSNIVDYGMDLPAAVTLPRFHHQHLPDTLLYEDPGLDPSTLLRLRAMGHALRNVSTLGSAPSILRYRNHWVGIADPRTGGIAEGE